MACVTGRKSEGIVFHDKHRRWQSDDWVSYRGSLEALAHLDDVFDLPCKMSPSTPQSIAGYEEALGVTNGALLLGASPLRYLEFHVTSRCGVIVPCYPRPTPSLSVDVSFHVTSRCGVLVPCYPPPTPSLSVDVSLFARAGAVLRLLLPTQLEAPNRMEGLLISNQISAYCSQINKFAGSSFEKLFLAGSLQKA